MFNKRGISNVIATLLLVLLVIVLIGIVWVVIQNLVSSSSQGISLGGLTLNLKITQAAKGANTISVTVQRQPGAGNLVGVNFVFSDGLTYEAIKQNANLSIYEGRTFTLSPQQVSINSAKTVSVAPIYNSENGGAQQIGGITDTYTFGNNTLLNGNTCTPASNPTFADLCTNNGYTCGDVNNGSCSAVDCGDCNPSQTCNLITHQCVNIGPTCSPAPNSTFAGLCTNNGYTCGSVSNGTCGDISCGSCGTGQYCNLSNFQCADSQNPTCNPSTCQISNYQCGTPPDGCGGQLSCGACKAGSFCDTYWQCESYVMSNSGIISSVWPSNVVYFFNSSSLPTSGTDIATYNDGAHYVRFPGSNEPACIRLSLMDYIPDDGGLTYVKLYSVANISSGNNYQIWNSQEGCSDAISRGL